MIIACPRCETSYVVDDAMFGSRNRVVQCSACDCRWSQRPHQAIEDDAGEGSPLAIPNANIGDPADRLQPILEAGSSAGPEATVPEGPVPAGAEQTATPPAPATEAISATQALSAAAVDAGSAAAVDAGSPASSADGLLSGQVRYTLQEQPSPPDAPNVASAEAAVGPTEGASKAEQPNHRFGRAWVAGMAALATILTLIGVLLLLRQPIVAILPDAAVLYGLIGLAPDTLGRGLEIREVASTRDRVGGEEVLSVTGVVANVSGRRELLPALRISLYDTADEELQFVTVPPEKESLDAGETIRFQTTIPGSSAEARRLRVGFTPP